MESLLALNVRNARVRVKYSQRYYYHGTLSLLGLVSQESSPSRHPHQNGILLPLLSLKSENV